LHLKLSRNRIKGADAGKALAQALAANTILRELDLSSNWSGAAFAQAFAAVLKTNRTLTKLNLASNSIVSVPSAGNWMNSSIASVAAPAQEPPHSGGADAIADAINNMGALPVELNLAFNGLDAKIMAASFFDSVRRLLCDQFAGGNYNMPNALPRLVLKGNINSKEKGGNDEELRLSNDMRSLFSKVNCIQQVLGWQCSSAAAHPKKRQQTTENVILVMCHAPLVLHRLLEFLV
jgi:hypothetical protein